MLTMGEKFKHRDVIVVKKNKLDAHNLFLTYFVKLYVFRAYLGPSSGGTNVCRGVTLTPHPLLVPRSKNREELYLYSP
jgi:hypothetical protein